mgnify:CR=1 FL=1
MANTTSGTTTFDKTFAIDEIIEEAYERIGMQGVSGNQLRMARRSLNIMFQEWANRGLHYWQVGNNNITLVADQAVYTIFRSTGDGTSSTTAIFGVDDILEACFRNNNVDSPLTKINRSQYQAVGDYTNATDVPYRFVPCMVSGLAFYLAQKFKPQMVQQMKMLYEDEFQRALSEDGSPASTHISPKVYYPEA